MTALGIAMWFALALGNATWSGGATADAGSHIDPNGGY